MAKQDCLHKEHIMKIIELIEELKQLDLEEDIKSVYLQLESGITLGDGLIQEEDLRDLKMLKYDSEDYNDYLTDED